MWLLVGMAIGATLVASAIRLFGPDSAMLGREDAVGLPVVAEQALSGLMRDERVQRDLQRCVQAWQACNVDQALTVGCGVLTACYRAGWCVKRNP